MVVQRVGSDHNRRKRKILGAERRVSFTTCACRVRGYSCSARECSRFHEKFNFVMVSDERYNMISDNTVTIYSRKSSNGTKETVELVITKHFRGGSPHITDLHTYKYTLCILIYDPLDRQSSTCLSFFFFCYAYECSVILVFTEYNSTRYYS